MLSWRKRIDYSKHKRGDVWLQTYGAGVWSTLALMGVSAVCASATDLAFDLNGYLWQLVNCVFTAGYSLYLRGVMDRVKLSGYIIFP